MRICFVVYLFYATGADLPDWIEVHVGDVINYQIEYSVPKYGLDGKHSHRISKETMYTSICQMMNIIMAAMKQDWYNYIGCDDTFKTSWNDTASIYFFSPDIGQNANNECKITLITWLSGIIQGILRQFGVMDTEIIKITDASVKHNVTVFRGHLKQKSDEQMKFEVCKTEEDTKYRYRTRLKLNNCFHKSSAELQNNTRLLTYWSGCPRWYDLLYHVMEYMPGGIEQIQKIFDVLLQCSADFNTTKGFSNIGKKTTRTEESPPKHNALTGGTAKTTSKQGRTTESRNSGGYKYFTLTGFLFLLNCYFISN
ncbi:unnamed protein product [Fasciola hepatica]|uniref:Uncharacterized protein n=1 Tax=Fasciola hepatica TaxID=6192 RepID=A0ABC9HII0_FASHE